MRAPRARPIPRGGVPINFPPQEDLPMKARAKVDDPDFRVVEYIGIDEVEVKGPTGRNYHLGEDPEETKVPVHVMDLNYLRAVGLIKMRANG